MLLPRVQGVLVSDRPVIMRKGPVVWWAGNAMSAKHASDVPSASSGSLDCMQAPFPAAEKAVAISGKGKA